MASYHVEIKSGGKGAAAEHARYIVREGKHSKTEDLLEADFGNMPLWAESDPMTFWKAADKFERANGAAYRELVIAMPNEFNADQHKEFAAKAIGELIAGKPYQYAIHQPVAKLDGAAENTHLHLMFSDRKPDEHERSPAQTFARYNPAQPERGGCKKDSGGKTSMQLRDEVIAKRKMVADIQNAMLKAIGASTRVDHRSHRARGIESQPERHLGQARIKGMSAEDRATYVAGRTKD